MWQYWRNRNFAVIVGSKNFDTQNRRRSGRHHLEDRGDCVVAEYNGRRYSRHEESIHPPLADMLKGTWKCLTDAAH